MYRVSQIRIPLLAIILMSGFIGNDANAAGFVPKLAGAWQIVGTPDLSSFNPAGCGPAEPFNNLVSIGRDGSVTNVDPLVGTGIGDAYRSGWNRYTVGFFGFINAGPGGILTYEVQGTIKQPNLGEFAGKFRTTITDPAENECTYDGTIVGTRLVAMPY